jgi:hypothetical protein
MNIHEIVMVVMLLTVAATTVPFASNAFAYNKYGFDNQTQCINITNLEFQGGFFDNSTYTKLIGMCEHRPAANTTET